MNQKQDPFQSKLLEVVNNQIVPLMLGPRDRLLVDLINSKKISVLEASRLIGRSRQRVYQIMSNVSKKGGEDNA